MTDDARESPSDRPGGASSAAVDARLDRLERTVLALSAEVASLRQALDRGPAARPAPTDDAFARAAGPWRATEARPAPPTGAPLPGAATRPSITARTRAPWESLDVESLVGRYGTMVLGALTIVLGVGAFLSWAVQRVQLGPGARVALGALAAVAVGALGVWLRGRGTRGTRRFGNVLLALALALVHVVAWGAGPVLGVVPPAAALAVAAAASLALAALAWSDGEQPLFVVGVGGALLAPFVTAREAGDPLALLGYGLLVFGVSVAALRERRWPWAARVLTAGALAYAGVALDATAASWAPGIGGGRPWVRRDAPAVFVLLAAWTTLAVGGREHRSAIVRQLLLVLLLAVAWRGAQTVGSAFYPELVVVATLGAATLYAALRTRDVPQPLAEASALVQPALLLLAALSALAEPSGAGAALVTALFAALAGLAALDAGAVPILRDAAGDPAGSPAATGVAAPVARRPVVAPIWALHLLVALLMAGLALGFALEERPLLAVVALAALGAGAAWLARRAGESALLAAPFLVLVAATLWVGERLDAREARAFVPFVNGPALAALACVAAWWVTGRHAADVVRPPAWGATERTLLRALGPAAAFVWGWVELANAFTPEVSAFTLILYLATVGVFLILLGRRRAVPGSRKVGLALAVLAAFKAMGEASDFDAVGLRVGSYLLVGGFLLAVAYWYRAAGEPTPDEREAAATPPDPPPDSLTLRP